MSRLWRALALPLLLARTAWQERRRGAEAPARPPLRQRLWTAAALLALLGAAGAVVLFSGIVPIKASAGHWALTEWVLQLAKRRSVATHTLGAELPPLEDPALVLKGAGHYELGCRPCHGSPELHHPRVARAMLPRPPYLPPRVARWEPEELFHLVKHGIKFTGMPAWPALARDDEVRAVVAFLRVFPELDLAGYRRLVHGEPPEPGEVPPLPALEGPGAAPREVLASCARCHGTAGAGRGVGAFPKLAGQQRAYLLAALEAFAGDRRQSGIMQPIAAGLTPNEMRALARHYGALAAAPPRAPPVAAAARARGQEIAVRGIPAQNVPSCQDCHGPGPGRRNPAYPLLAGQYADYLELQLQLFHGGRRGGSPYAHIMEQIARRLTREQMHDAAAYYHSLAPEHHASPGVR